MSKKRSNFVKSYQEKTILDSLLWFLENYLPQKNKKSSHEESLLANLESDSLNKIKKLASSRSKLSRGDLYKTKITFTVGNWALPYLNFLKRIKILN